MIERLLKEAAAEASHKAWCDEEMSESKAKKEKLTATVEDLTTKIDKATADVGRLTEEIATLRCSRLGPQTSFLFASDELAASTAKLKARANCASGGLGGLTRGGRGVSHVESVVGGSLVRKCVAECDLCSIRVQGRVTTRDLHITRTRLDRANVYYHKWCLCIVFP